MKIDLSEVNKKPAKSSKEMENRLTKALHAKFKKHLNKQKGPARDTEGKFTSGSGGLKIAKKLNNKRALSVIVVVSLIGGLFVFQSFAASSANKAKVVSWYRTCLNREPESQSAVDTWAGQLDKYPKSEWTIAADFMKRAGVTSCNYPNTSKAPVATSTTAQKPAATSGSSSNQVPAATSGSSNSTSPNAQGASMTSAQVVALYKEILGRDPSQSEINSWVERSKTWTPAQIKAHLQQSSEGFKTNIAAKLQEAQAWKTLADAHVTNAKTYNDQTYKLSTQTVVSKENLDTISQRVGSVRSAIGQVNSGLSTINDSSQKAAAIGAAETSQFQTIARSLASSLQQLSGYLKNIENDYARAEKTYKANLGFFEQLLERQRKEQDCRSKGGTPTWNGGCDIPPAIVPVNPGRGPGSGGSSTSSGNSSIAAPSDNGGGQVGDSSTADSANTSNNTQSCYLLGHRDGVEYYADATTKYQRTYSWIKNSSGRCVKRHSAWVVMATARPRRNCPAREYDTRTTTKYWPNIFGTTVYQLRQRSNDWDGFREKCTHGNWSKWKDVDKTTYDRYN
ncbi:MAG: hypothetical protein U0520_02600 [Candidatus Saccharimonadales bacterium]